MEKLEKKPKLQFVYIEPLYKQFIFEYKEQKKEQKIIIEDEQFAQSILGLYIKLLCITGQKEKWFQNKEEFIINLNPTDEKYSNFFEWDANEINDFFDIEIIEDN